MLQQEIGYHPLLQSKSAYILIYTYIYMNVYMKTCRDIYIYIDTNTDIIQMYIYIYRYKLKYRYKDKNRGILDVVTDMDIDIDTNIDTHIDADIEIDVDIQICLYIHICKGSLRSSSMVDLGEDALRRQSRGATAVKSGHRPIPRNLKW